MLLLSVGTAWLSGHLYRSALAKGSTSVLIVLPFFHLAHTDPFYGAPLAGSIFTLKSVSSHC